ncbi:hypothetical protein PGTUg99_023703 [Puccinia graminis f. sp. tritici]|uniref:Uncharacterized protein n=1 Tax=Puccinia graminis f. sp. tritici TaxID=56615 RepID=A0A5B0NIY5_PUCGR|nr:hypothetical protein PGTUg99_023703 [Puccinia graminis f. sp. tritici]
MIIGKIDLLHMALYTLGVSQFILSTPIEGFGDTGEIQRGRSGYQNSRIGEAGYSGAGRSRNGRSKGKGENHHQYIATASNSTITNLYLTTTASIDLEPERMQKNYKSQIETHQQLQNKYPDYDQHEAAKITSRLHQLLVDNSKNEVSTDKMGDEINQISSEFGSWLVKIKANQITNPHPEFVQDFNNVYLKLIPQARQKLIERLRQENKIYP